MVEEQWYCIDVSRSMLIVYDELVNKFDCSYDSWMDSFASNGSW